MFLPQLEKQRQALPGDKTTVRTSERASVRASAALRQTKITTRLCNFRIFSDENESSTCAKVPQKKVIRKEETSPAHYSALQCLPKTWSPLPSVCEVHAPRLPTVTSLGGGPNSWRSKEVFEQLWEHEHNLNSIS